jgi:hypothetical protein
MLGKYLVNGLGWCYDGRDNVGLWQKSGFDLGDIFANKPILHVIMVGGCRGGV